MHTFILGANWQTRLRKQLKRRNMLRRNSLDVDAQVNTLMKTNAEREGVAESRI
jgi:hypothetical protein